MPPRLTTEQVRARVREIDDGEYHLVGEYIAAGKPISILHAPCGSITEVRAKGFLQEGDGRCRACHPSISRRGPKMTAESFLVRLGEQLGEPAVLAKPARR